jgi:hypothetical protein
MLYREIMAVCSEIHTLNSRLLTNLVNTHNWGLIPVKSFLFLPWQFLRDAIMKPTVCLQIFTNAQRFASAYFVCLPLLYFTLLYFIPYMCSQLNGQHNSHREWSVEWRDGDQRMAWYGMEQWQFKTGTIPALVGDPGRLLGSRLLISSGSRE